jgi:hypothetical protein
MLFEILDFTPLLERRPLLRIVPDKLSFAGRHWNEQMVEAGESDQ